MTALFKLGNFQLASGQHSWWKLDCDGLDAEDWEVLARLAIERFPWIREYTPTGVPTGGDAFAEALEPYCVATGPPLIVDDVLTTGGSIERVRADLEAPEAPGLVAFARGPLRVNVIALWRLE